ncbi:MAG: phage portal protein [Candidatus Dormiibacterota bacterium]
MAFWSRPTADEIADKIIEKASIHMPGGVKQLPAGTTTMTLTQEQARALANGNLMSPTQLLPRNPADAVANFGPSQPLPSQPLDPLQVWGRPLPRRSEYPVAWNLQLKPQRIVPFEILKACADQCDVVRRCIDIRKQALQEQDWDIALTASATAQLMANDDSIKSPVKAQAMGRVQYADVIERIRAFLEEPDPINHLSWTEWLGNLLEEHFVYDALSVYPWRAYGGDVVALVILDGATIKPLLDEYGNTPQPPYPAFQQILYGYPRGEFQAAPNPDAEFLSDQLFYRPRDRRSGTPYGCSPTEKALPMADLWLKRQAWMRDEWAAGVQPRVILKTNAPMQPSDRQQHEASMNDEMSGDGKARHRWKVLPEGFDPILLGEMAEKYKSDYDEFLVQQIGSKFAVMPTQLGIIPARGWTGGATEAAGQNDISETLGDGPLEEWVIDVVNAVCRLYLGMPKELTLTFTGGGIDEDALVKAQTQVALTGAGLRTLNDVRAENGDSLYTFPEADMPFIQTASGPDFLPGSSIQPAPAGPDSKPPPAAPRLGREADSPTRSEVRKAAEIDQFRTFAAKRAGKTWRDFEFASVTPSMASALNSAGQRGDLHAIKVLTATAEGTIPKALAPQQEPPQTLEADRIAAEVTDALAQALGAGWTGAALLEAVFALEPDLEKHPTQAGVIKALTTLGFLDAQQRLLGTVLTPPVEEAYEIGWQEGAKQAPTGYTPEESLRLGGLQRTLEQLHIELKGVSETSVNEIGDILAQAISDGEGSTRAAELIAPVLHDPERAQLIARTEIARAMEGALLAQAQAMGGTDKSWSDAPGACPICQANTAEGPIALDKPFAGGALHPPQHPRCRCALVLIPKPF